MPTSQFHVLWLVCILVLCAAPTSLAEVYRVGPEQRYTKVSQVAQRLEPGDVVEVTGDMTDSFVLYKHGTRERPITIRGTGAGSSHSRPRIVAETDADVAVRCHGRWNVLEGLDISGITKGVGWGFAIHVQASDVVIRNCRIHHSLQGIGTAGDVDNLLVEYCEFDSLGSGTRMHSLYATSVHPLATCIVQFCYFHDATGGHMLKSRFARNIIRYNWFESPYYCMMQIADNVRNPDDYTGELGDYLHPMHSDIVGNAFIQGDSPGAKFAILTLGGEGVDSPGTEGDFNLAHNLFIMAMRDSDFSGPPVALLLHGNVDRVRAYNNVCLEFGGGARMYLRDAVWPDSVRTPAFVKKRGEGAPVLEGAGNWVSTGTTAVPEEFTGTLRGTNPRFVDLLRGDYSPRADSPLAGAGVRPLPRGRLVDLVPEYEPQRGIPSDLKPRLRRKAASPSIGPFEVVE